MTIRGGRTPTTDTRGTAEEPHRLDSPWFADGTAGSPRAIGLTIAAVVLIIGVHLAGRVGGYCCPIEANDSYIFASFGYRIAHGDVLYRDMSDIKPPGLFLIYAFVYLTAPATRQAIVGVESVFLLLGYCVIYQFGVARFGRAAGLAAAVVAALAVNYFTVTGFTIGGFGVGENFMVFPAAAAAIFYLRGIDTGRAAPLILAGVCMGVDTCIKQTALPLVMAIVIHGSVVWIVMERSAWRLLRGWGLLFVGGCLGWAPALIVLVSQGTLDDAITLLTRDAGTMFGRSSAWPTQWRDVWPLCVPLAWGLWAVAGWIESRIRHRGATGGRPFAGVTNDVLFLVLWCVLESYLLGNLPLRSSHYFIAACVPFVLLSSAPVAAFARAVGRWPHRARLTAWSMGVIASAVFCRSVVDEIVPRAIAFYHSYDWSAEAARFQDAIHWGPIHFGRGEPFLQENQDTD